MTKAPAALPPTRLWQPENVRWFFGVFGISLAYAITRYHLTGTVPWRHLPLFITNKATALAAILLLSTSFAARRIIPRYRREPALGRIVSKFCGLTGFGLAIAHSLFSLCLLSPAYFAKHFADGRLTFGGEIAVLTGVLALLLLVLPAVASLPLMPRALGATRWRRRQHAGYLALWLALTHVVALGWVSWLVPQDWPAHLPPISLLAALSILLPLAQRVRREPED